MNRPWMKFFTSDWRSDPRLRMCSIAARGLWLEMICLMHEADPYGHLLVNGQVVTVKQLAILAGVPLNETSKLLSELEIAGVYSVEQDTIISRRMVRDKAKAENDRANGKDGGNPGLLNGVNPPVKGEDKAKKLEARSQISEKKEFCPKRVRTSYPDDFENRFWKAYPRTPTMAKTEAFKAWQKLSDGDREAAIGAISKYREWLAKHPTQETVHACRFLSQRRFDGFAEEPVANGNGESRDIFIPVESPQWGFLSARWREQNRKTGPPTKDHDGVTGWYFPKEWATA